MKRLALLFLVAVLVPCGVLAWFAQRAMKDEQATFHRQQVLLAQEKSAALATRCRELLLEQLKAFEKATDDYLVASARGEGDGLGAESGESEVARWDKALKQRYGLAERGYLARLDDSNTTLALADKVETFARFTEQLYDTAPQAADVADNVIDSRKALLLGENLMGNHQQRRAGGLGGAAVLDLPADAEGLDSVESKLGDIATKDSAAGAPSPASPPINEETASARPAPAAAMKAENSPTKSTTLVSEPGMAGGGLNLAKEKVQVARDGDGPVGGAEIEQEFAKKQQTRGLSESLGRSGVERAEDSFGTEASDKKLDETTRTALNRRTTDRWSRKGAKPEERPAADRREIVALGVRTVRPLNLSSEDQVRLAKISTQVEKLPSLEERMRTENSGIAATVSAGASFQLAVWYRSPRQPEVVYGGEISLPKFLETLRVLAPETGASDESLCLAVLDQQGKPAFQTESGFSTDWSRPYASVEIGTMLPQWEAAVYLLRPDALQVGARAAQWRLGLIVLAVLVAAIGGGALFWVEARRRWREAQQKTDFVSQVSHELRTPLTAIQMFSDLLMKEAPNTEPAKAQRYASVISQEAQRLTRLINTVLDFSKLDRKGVALDRVDCDLRRIVEDTLERYRPHLESLGLAVSAELPEEPVLLQADADRVAQILLNLLSNAEKYAADGKVIEVTLAQDPATHTAVVEVSDRGPGIPAGQEKKIFEKFYRADDRLHSGIHGTGLGLTLARALARAHGGDVIYARRAGGGSTFTLRLPA